MKISIYILFLLFLFSSCQNSLETQNDTLFQKKSSAQSGLNFENTLTETETWNIIQYLYYYNGGGVAIGDINNDDLPDIYLTANQLPNKLFLNKGNLQFEDITKNAGVGGAGDWKTGVTMADVNADGLLDIYVCHLSQYKGIRGKNELFINNGDNTFSEKAAAFGLDFQGFSTQATFFDYDKDGDLDMFLLNHSVHHNGNRDQRERELARGRDLKAGDRLYKNDNGIFVDVSEKAGILGIRIGFGLSASVSDLNEDGLPDIYVCNDFHENDYLYYNNGNGTFTEAIERSIQHTSNFSMGSDIADINNDGLFDIITLDMKPEEETVLKRSEFVSPFEIFELKKRFGYQYQYPRNNLQLNQGDLNGDGKPEFSEIAELANVAATDWSWSSLFADFDNNGWKDLFISNGIVRRPNDLDYLKYSSNQQIQQQATDLELAAQMPDGAAPNYVFSNTGVTIFEDKSKDWGLDEVGYSNGAAYADLDNDGDLDLVVNNINAPVSLFENKTNEKENNHFLKVKLNGNKPNTKGIGATISIIKEGKKITNQNYTTRGFQSCSDNVLHFGLGKDLINGAYVDAVLVTWQTGEQQTLKDIPINQTITLNQSDAILYPSAAQSSKEEVATIFTNVTDQLNINFNHKEDPFIDFNVEKLIPHRLSAAGPRIAIGDVNGDELEDFFVCGARGQAGGLFVQKANATFQNLPVELLEQHKLFEDTDAAFFDADSDGDQDLYVVSGGSETYLGNPSYFQDRLYLNDGKGNFSISYGLPTDYGNGSCVVVEDFDEDGDQDIFVGSRSVPNQYGMKPESTFWQNDGKGVFKKIKIPSIDKHLGMVTDAIVQHGNMGKKHLIIANEWGAIIQVNLETFTWTDNNFVSPISDFGWWNRIYNAKLDNYTPTVLAGNLGLNTSLKASKEEPLQLYVNDFDENGTTDPIMTYYRQNKEFVFASKDALAEQITAIKKDYPTYKGFSEVAFKDVFPNNNAQVSKIEDLTSGYLENPIYNAIRFYHAHFTSIYAIISEDFNRDGKMDLLFGGNDYELQPSIGRLDASSICLYIEKENKGLVFVSPSKSGLFLEGQIRDLKIIKLATGTKALLVGRNDGRLEAWFF